MAPLIHLMATLIILMATLMAPLIHLMATLIILIT